MSSQSPPPAPRRSTRTRPNLPPKTLPSKNLPKFPTDRPADNDSAPLPRLKLDSTSSTKPKNLSTKNVSAKSAAASASNELREKGKVARTTSAQGKKESENVDKITRGIQKISIASHPPIKKTPRSKPPTSLSEDKPVVPLAEQINLAMKTVNGSLSKLSSIRQTGWKAEPAFTDPNSPHLKNYHSDREKVLSVSDCHLEEALDAINRGYTAIQTLRKLISNSAFTNKSFDIERAGLALVNHAIELRLYNSALRLLDVAHCYIQALIFRPVPAPLQTASAKTINPSPIAPTSWQSFSKVMSFLIPKSKDEETPPNLNHVAVLVLAGVAQGFQAFLNGNTGSMITVSRGSVKPTLPSVTTESTQIAQLRANCCLGALESLNPLVEWIISLIHHSSSSPDEPIIKKIVGAVQACYSAMVGACSLWEDLLEPRLLFQLRKSSVLLLLTCQIHLNQLKPTDTSMDQARRTILLYARSCPHRIADVVSEARIFFTQIVQTVQSKETPDGNCVDQNVGWRSLCEVMIGLARKIGDVELVNQTSTFLYSTSEGTHDHSRVTPDGQPPKEDNTSDKHAGLLLVKVTAATAALDLYSKTSEDKETSHQLDKCPLTIAALAHQRATMSREQYQKMNIIVDRLRRVCARALRKAPPNKESPPANNVLAASVSVSHAIVDFWLKDVELQADTIHNPVSDPAILSMMITGTTETLIALSESSFLVDSPDSHRKALQYLSRCAPILHLLPEPDVSVIRCLTSTYYNTGVALYQADKIAMAINFVRPSCELPSRFFNILQLDEVPARWSQYDDSNGEVEVLKNQLLKRWELLAVCYLQTDKSRSYQAYVSAVLSHPQDDFATLGKIADDPSGPDGALDALPGLRKLVQRATWLATCDILLPTTKCSLLESLAPKQLSRSEGGAILELQLRYLYQNTRKSECRLALKAILDDCSQIYQSVSHPFRRARTLVRLMEWHVSMSPDAKSGSTFQILKQLLADISELLDQPTYSGQDDGFKPYVQQYHALANMWLALAAQSRNLLKEFINASETAISTLEKITLSTLPGRPETSLKNEPTPKSKPRGTLKAKAPLRTRTALFKPDQTTNVLSTPPNKRPDPSNSMKTPERQGSSKSSRFLFTSTKNKVVSTNGVTNSLPLDESERFAQHLMLFTHVLGAHGLVSQKLRLLRFMQVAGPAESMASAHNGKHFESHVSTMIELASTYLHCEEYNLASTLLSDAERFIKTLPSHTLPSALTSESLISLLYSRCFSEADDPQSADSVFILAGEKWALAIEEEEDSNSNRNSDVSPAQKVIRRTQFLRVIALASFTYSHIKEKQGDLALAIEFATRAVRLLHRASSNILRISSSPQAKAPHGPSNPTQDVFSSNAKAEDCAPLPEIVSEVNPHSFTVESHPVGEITWQIAAMIPTALSRIIGLYNIRGSPRMAEAYLSQFSTVSDQIGSQQLKVSGMVIKACILTLKRQFDAAQIALNDASSMMGDRRTMELAEIYKLKCDISYKLKSFNEAKANCTELGRVLQDLDCNYIPVHQPTSSLHCSMMSSMSSKAQLLPPITSPQFLLIAAQANRMQVLVARAIRRPEQTTYPLRMLSKMPYKIREKVFETTLLAMLGLDDVLQNFKVDPLLGVLSEAMIVVPSAHCHQDQLKNVQDQFPQLPRSLRSMEEALTRRIVGCADIPNLFESIHVLITLKFINSILQRERKNVAGEVAALLDFVCSLTIRREMVECIRAKSRIVGPGDDTSWPSEVEEVKSASDEKRIGSISRVDLKRWVDVASHYKEDIRSPARYRPLQALPTGWRVVSIHVAFDEDSLFLIQHNESCDPLGVKLPLDRFNRREGEDDLFTLKVALEELQSIVSQSNAATQRARHVTERQDKISWWQERKELDIRMRQLVERIENDWLGACKGILRPSNQVKEMGALKSALENLFRHHLICSQDKTVYTRPLDEPIINCFISLPINCRDEDLEDLVQFVVDSYQVHEAPVVGDEVDVDQVVCELRNIQKEFLVEYSEEERSPQHLFLILDKHLHGFPWEVLPILMGHSVSRVPSLSFLRERLGYAQETTKTGIEAMPIDPTGTSYILNPTGDLTSTQLKFESWLESQPTWNGIKGRSPSSEEVKQALLSKNLMLYFGHGGAEQYIRSQTIKQLPRCAVTMLWGCSSGMLHDQGDFDPTGTPYAYMIAGCPALLANLWDVTDKDIDKLALDLFVKTGLQRPSSPPEQSDENATQSSMTLTGALALSRSVCQLKYLNGAAPVVYGIPVKFQARKDAASRACSPPVSPPPSLPLS